jgi:hypothetical protein
VSDVLEFCPQFGQRKIRVKDTRRRQGLVHAGEEGQGGYLMTREMRKNRTITAEAMRRIRRSRSVVAGMEPGHRECAGPRADSNIDQDAPRLAVAQDPPLPEDMPVTVGRTIR